jgi:sugar/nucleoside kinase (ribokinase family)
MSQKKFDVIVVGELNVDLIFDGLGEKLPEVGKEIIADEMILTLGSSSAILAANLSVLGPKVSFIGKVGKDNFADLVLDSFKEKGVDTSNIIQTDEHKTGITVACSYENDRAMVTHPGAMDHLTIEDINPEILKEAKHLHMSSVFFQNGLKPDIIDLFKMAKEAGLTTSFDPQWDPAEKWDIDLNALLPFVDVFLPNIVELQFLTQTESRDEALLQIADAANIVIVKDGTNGSYLWTPEKQYQQSIFINPDVVDAIGAGDSFNAGFISKFIQRKPLEVCMEFGALTGAINTTQAGGTTAFTDLGSIGKIALEKFDFTI